MNPERGRFPNSLIDELAADLAPVVPIRLWHGAALVALSALATIVLVELLDGLWRGIATGDASTIFFIANGMFGLLGAAAAGAVIHMASPRVGNRHEGARWSAAMLGLLPLSALFVLGIEGFGSAVTNDAYGLHCLLACMGFGLVTALALALWLRRGAPVSLVSAGTLTGIASGAIGSFAYGLACPIDTIAHLGFFHAGSVVIAGVLGRFAIPPLLRW